VVSAGADGTVRLWDAATGKCIRSHLHTDRAAAAWDGDGRLLYAKGRAWRYLEAFAEDDVALKRPLPLPECEAWEFD
jgi:WD40 repeat protein